MAKSGNVMAVCMALASPSAFAQPTPDGQGVPVYRGPVASPMLTRDKRLFRTRIREAFAQGVNFGAHYVVIAIGCGAGCRLVYVGDAKTGRVLDFPLSGESFFELELFYRPESSIIEGQWNDDEHGAGCVRRTYALTGGKFLLVRPESRLAGTCPG